MSADIAELVIRASIPADAAAIAALHNLANYRNGTLRLPFHSEPELRKRLETKPPEVTTLVAELNGQIVGDIALMRQTGRRQHVASIGMGVHDDFQRLGIGRALLAAIIDLADNWLNIARLELTVYTDNQAAIRLYESCGFVREGTHKAFAFRAGAYIDAHAMARLNLIRATQP
ncbi:GNAT family N-acetyltransferase [Allorhizobium undicola]|uniref:GNAT family N-acetyltransferase n=1 Tax=Allorhizobium undicola TaxID=78527 RepID=UPI003D32B766